MFRSRWRPTPTRTWWRLEAANRTSCWSWDRAATTTQAKTNRQRNICLLWTPPRCVRDQYMILYLFFFLFFFILPGSPIESKISLQKGPGQGSSCTKSQHISMYIYMIYKSHVFKYWNRPFKKTNTCLLHHIPMMFSQSFIKSLLWNWSRCYSPSLDFTS